MAETERTVRQSVSIPAGIARRVRTLAKTRKTSANRVLVDLIEAGLGWRYRSQSVRDLINDPETVTLVARNAEALAGFGIMKFGSRMDVFVPVTATLTVGVGERVRGGETVIAVLH